MNLLYKTPLLLLGAFCFAAVTETGITAQDREQGLRTIAESQKSVADAVRGLSAAQLNFKPAPDRWSVAELLEHIGTVEELVLTGVLPQLAQAAPAPAGRDYRQVDATLFAKMPDRTAKFKAPESIVPTGKWTPEVALEHIDKASAQLASALKSTPDLRAHVIPHPVLGPLDGYQWIVLAALHTERHTQQILEVKADPNFPSK